MKFTYILFFLLIPFIGAAQKDREVRRLESILDTATNYDLRMSTTVELAKRLGQLNLRLALGVVDNATKEASARRDSLNIAHFMQAKGRAYYFFGMFDSGIYFYYKAIPIFERHGQADDLAWLYNDLARTGRKTQDYARALEFYDKALEIFRADNNAEGEATILNESGVIFEYQGRYNEALQRYKQSLNIQRERKDQNGIAYSLSFIGIVLRKMNDLKQAEKYLLDAMNIRHQIADSFALGYNYADLGDLYAQSTNYAKAADAFLHGLTYAERFNIVDLQMEIHAALANAYAKLHNSDRAFFHLTLHNRLKDSLYNINKIKEIETIAAKYQTERQKAQLLEQEIEINKRNNAILLVVGAFIVAAVLTISYYRRMQMKQKNRLQQAVFEQQEMAAKAVMDAEEKERIRIARDLHDGVGQMMSAVKMNLSSIASTLRFDGENHHAKFSKIVSMVDESCKEVRQVSHNMMPNVMTKTSFEDALRTFLDHLDSDKIQVHLFTDGLKATHNKNVESVLYRVIQECVNNTIKHADATQLDITIIQDDKTISGTIEDNGKGFNIEAAEANGGIGVSNIKRRIEFLKGDIEWNTSPGNGVCVSFSVPI